MCATPEMFLEPQRRIPVAGRHDVVVAGGGIAGVAAAVAAARNGVSACLLEKQSSLGGLATLGNVAVYLPICDGCGRQVIGGLGEELLKLSVADLGQEDPQARFIGIPRCWRPGGDPRQRRQARYTAEFNPAAFCLALEQLVTDAGVHLLYDTRVCQVGREGDRITHLIVENKGGRAAIGCRDVVDATGDADICRLAGERTESLDSNVLSAWFYTVRNGVLHQHQLSHAYSPSADRQGATGPFFCGDDGEQVTAQILGSRQLMRARLADMRARDPHANVQVIMPPTIACFRMTRRLVGDFSLSQGHMHQWFDDAVGLTGDWRKAGPVYSLPLRMLRAGRNRNLLAAGRCVSADTTVWDCTRAIPSCAVTGEAAGTAAAIAAQEAAGDLNALDIRRLQARLRRQGGLLDPALVRPADPVV